MEDALHLQKYRRCMNHILNDAIRTHPHFCAESFFFLAGGMKLDALVGYLGKAPEVSRSTHAFAPLF